MPFVRLATQSELPAINEVKEFSCAGKMICVSNVDGEIRAMDNICLHRGGPLGEGVIQGGKVICPWHGWAWDPKTGEAQAPGAKIAVYPVKIENGEVLIEIQVPPPPTVGASGRMQLLHASRLDISHETHYD